MIDTSFSVRLFLRTVLILAAVIGFGYSIFFNQQLSTLRQRHAALRARVGLLDVVDPDQVVITHVAVTDDLIPPGVTKAHVWQFRMHIPANYGPYYHNKQGLVKADSPQGRGGSGGSWSSPKPDPIETLATYALIQTDDQWLFCATASDGSSSTVLPNDFTFDSMDDLTIEPVVTEGETRVFDRDEAICLFRLRKRELAKKRDGTDEEDLYQGYVIYLLSQKHKDDFDAWASGQTNAMRESLP